VLDDLLVSHIFETYEGDTRFPEFLSEFPQSERIEIHDTFEVIRHFRWALSGAEWVGKGSGWLASFGLQP